MMQEIVQNIVPLLLSTTSRKRRQLCSHPGKEKIPPGTYDVGAVDPP